MYVCILVHVSATPGLVIPGLAFAYLVDDDRQEPDSLSSDVQVRISGTRYLSIFVAFSLSYSLLSARSFHHRVWWIPPCECVCMHSVYMPYGRSHGHERWNAPASQHAHTLLRGVRVEEPLMSLAVFLDRPCVIGRRRRGRKGTEGRRDDGRRTDRRNRNADSLPRIRERAYVPDEIHTNRA